MRTSRAIGSTCISVEPAPSRMLASLRSRVPVGIGRADLIRTNPLIAGSISAHNRHRRPDPASTIGTNTPVIYSEKRQPLPFFDNMAPRYPPCGEACRLLQKKRAYVE